MQKSPKFCWKINQNGIGLQFLREGNWGAAADSVEKAIAALGPQGLERSLSIINRHLNELGDLSDSEEVTLNLIREARQKLATAQLKTRDVDERIEDAQQEFQKDLEVYESFILGPRVMLPGKSITPDK